MEENESRENKVNNLGEDAVKEEVKNKAEANSRIDEKTAVVDEENKIVDMDTILANPQNADLANVIINLQNLGISMEYIRKLLEVRGEFSVGSTEDELVEALNSLTKQLIKDISETSNGIVLNADGTINAEESEIKQAKIDAMRDVNNNIFNKEDNQTLASKLFSSKETEEITKVLNIEKINFYLEKYGSDLNGYDDEAKKKLAESMKKSENHFIESRNNLPKEEQKKLDDSFRMGFYEKKEEVEVVRAFVNFEKNILRNSGINKAYEIFENEIEKIGPRETIYQILKDKFDFDFEINIDNVEKIRECTRIMVEQRNKRNIYSNFKNLYIDDKNQFDELSDEDKEKVAINIAKALKNPNDSFIKMELERYEKLLGRSFKTQEDGKKFLEEILKIKIDNLEEYLISTGNVCTIDNIGAELAEAEQAIEENRSTMGDADFSTYVRTLNGKQAQEVAKSRIPNAKCSLQENYVRELLLEYTDNFNEKNATQNCLIVLSLYNEYRTNSNQLGNDNIINGIDNFIKDYAQIFIDKFGKDIFIKDNSRVNITRLNNILNNPKYKILDENSLDNLKNKIDKELLPNYQKGRKRYSKSLDIISKSDNIDIIRNIINFNDSEIIEYLTREEIQRLRKFNDKEITEKLDTALVITRQDTLADLQLEEAFLLVESKKELFKNTPEYEKIYKECEDAYNSSKDLKEKKDIEENVDAENLHSKVEAYIDKVYSEELRNLISSNINQQNDNSKANYNMYLLAGLETNNLELNNFAKAALKREFARTSTALVMKILNLKHIKLYKVYQIEKT